MQDVSLIFRWGATKPNQMYALSLQQQYTFSNNPDLNLQKCRHDTTINFNTKHFSRNTNLWCHLVFYTDDGSNWRTDTEAFTLSTVHINKNITNTVLSNCPSYLCVQQRTERLFQEVISNTFKNRLVIPDAINSFCYNLLSYYILTTFSF